MTVKIRRVQMRQTSIRNMPAVLAATLEPLAQARVDLIEILAGSGRRAARAAQAAGFTLRFLSAQVVGERYSALLGFQTDTDTRQARALIRKGAAASSTAKTSLRREE